MNSSPLQLTRREDRETALAMLYEADMTGDDLVDVINRNDSNPADYGTVIVTGVAEHASSIDAEIDAVAEDWRVDRMPGIDRAILRMGVWELLYRADVPTTAVVSEAVALANQYSTEKSAPFINGVLVKLASIHRPDAGDEDE